MGLNRGQYSHFLLADILHSGRESEICDLGVHLVVDEHVAKLEVAMDNVLGVEVLAALHELTHVVTDLRLREGLAGLHHVHQRLQSGKVKR
jgi:hypothetical protein